MQSNDTEDVCANSLKLHILPEQWVGVEGLQQFLSVRAYNLADISSSALSHIVDMGTEAMMSWFNTSCSTILNLCAPSKIVTPKARYQPRLNEITRAFRQKKNGGEQRSSGKNINFKCLMRLLKIV